MKSRIKLILQISLVLAFAFTFVGVANVKAQQGGLTFTSGLQVVNLSNSTASITLHFFKSDGTEATTAPVTDTINANSSKTYFPLQGPNLGFNGSMVIESDVAVAAIANLQTTALDYGDATVGFSNGSNQFNLPLIMCNNSNFNTFFNVQNAGATDAHITINYIPGSFGNPAGASETDTIKPGASHTFDQATGSSTVNCSTLKDATGKFIGSAKITSDVPVVATVMQLNTVNFKILLGYNGFGTGATNMSLPLIMANNSGFYTGVQIQNVGGATTTVTVTYSPNTASGQSWNPPSGESFSLAAGASKTIIQNSTPPVNGSAIDWTGHRYIGSATISSSGGQPLVAIVNETSLGGSGAGPYGSSYMGFDPSTATNQIAAPLIMANNSGFYTGIQVQNIGSTACTNIVLTYGPNTSGTGGNPPSTENFSLDPGASKTIIQNGAPPANGSAINWTGQKYIGSANIVGPASCKLGAIINEFRAGAGDTLFTYNGFFH